MKEDYSKEEVETIRKYNQERRKNFSKDMKDMINTISMLMLMIGNFAIFAWLNYFYIYEEIITGIGVPYFYYGFIGISLINCFVYCIDYNNCFKK